VLLPGVGSAAGGGLAQPAYPHPNQYVYADSDIYPCSSNRYSAASDRNGHRNGDDYAIVYAIAYLYTVPDPHGYPNDDFHNRSPNVNLYAHADGYGFSAGYRNSHTEPNGYGFTDSALRIGLILHGEGRAVC